jgi:DNA-binding response OmpR family regulator
MNVLVVEDEPLDLELIVWSLRDGGYKVDLVASGQEGLIAARAEPYDVIVLDLLLPDMTGIDVVRTLRAEMLTVPILLLTATTDVKTRVEALDAGADDYLTKPFDIDELRARLRALTRRAGGAEPD